MSNKELCPISARDSKCFLDRMLRIACCFYGDSEYDGPEYMRINQSNAEDMYEFIRENVYELQKELAVVRKFRKEDRIRDDSDEDED
jgi:hypothetical protein